MIFETLSRVLFFREGGHVERAHTIPKVGSYPVGLHSFNMANLLLLLHPGPSLDLIRAALWHDLHERATGDVPSPTKRFCPELATVESAAQAEFGTGVQLDPSDRMWLRAVDVLELYLWVQDQLAFGNRHVENVEASVVDWFAKNEIPEEVRTFLRDFRWRRENVRDERKS